ncbi:MAG: hypothetical protein ABIJ92_01760 [Candidatus Aenigmatarchaeota archaeon]
MKGVWYLIEAVLSVLIIITFLIAIKSNVFDITSQPDVSLTGYSLLKGLDDRGVLRNYTVNKDFTAINSSISYFVYNHTVEICDHLGACIGDAPNATNAFVSTYIISGDGYYNPYEVRLYLYS